MRMMISAAAYAAMIAGSSSEPAEPGDSDGVLPVAVIDTRQAMMAVPITVNVLANDVHPSGDILAVVSATVDPAQGTVTINVDGTLTFTSAAGFTGSAVVTYVIEDEDGDQSTSTLTLNVVSDPTPVITTANVSMVEDETLTYDLLQNVAHAGGDDLTVTTVSLASGSGTITNHGDGSVTFTPTANWNGNASISFTVEDEDGDAATGLLRILVYAAGDPPSLGNDTATTDQAVAVVVSVMTNDTHPDLKSMTLMSVSVAGGSATGTATIVNDTQIRFAPNPSFLGTAVLTYTVQDSADVEATATLTITVVSNPDVDPNLFVDAVDPYYARQVAGASSGITAGGSAHWGTKEGLGGPTTTTGTEWRMTVAGTRGSVSLTASGITMVNGKTRVRWRCKPVGVPSAIERLYVRFDLVGMSATFNLVFDVTDDSTLNADRIFGNTGIISNAGIARNPENGWWYLRFDVDMTGMADRVGQMIVHMLDQPGADLLMDRTTFFLIRCENLSLTAV